MVISPLIPYQTSKLSSTFEGLSLVISQHNPWFIGRLVKRKVFKCMFSKNYQQLNLMFQVAVSNKCWIQLLYVVSWHLLSWHTQLRKHVKSSVLATCCVHTLFHRNPPLLSINDSAAVLCSMQPQRNEKKIYPYEKQLRRILLQHSKGPIKKLSLDQD